MMDKTEIAAGKKPQTIKEAWEEGKRAAKEVWAEHKRDQAAKREALKEVGAECPTFKESWAKYQATPEAAANKEAMKQGVETSPLMACPLLFLPIVGPVLLLYGIFALGMKWEEAHNRDRARLIQRCLDAARANRSW